MWKVYMWRTDNIYIWFRKGRRRSSCWAGMMLNSAKLDTAANWTLPANLYCYTPLICVQIVEWNVMIAVLIWSRILLGMYFPVVSRWSTKFSSGYRIRRTCIYIQGQGFEGEHQLAAWSAVKNSSDPDLSTKSIWYLPMRINSKPNNTINLTSTTANMHSVKSRNMAITNLKRISQLPYNSIEYSHQNWPFCNTTISQNTSYYAFLCVYRIQNH